jgi:hypothetical protein
MAPLDGFPGIALRFAIGFLFAGMPSDGSGIENDTRAVEGGQARSFRIPLESPGVK